MLESHAKGLAKDKVNLDGILVEKFFRDEAVVLCNATKESSQEILQLSLTHEHIGIVVQNPILDVEALLKILDRVAANRQELVESLLCKGIIPIQEVSLGIFEILAGTKR